MNSIIKYGSVNAIPLYNCSLRTLEECAVLNGRKWPLLGIFDMIYGITVNIVYSMILRIMIRPENIKHSCFKIMVSLGIVDIVGITVNSIITGYLAFQGSVFCSYPILIYYSGSIGIGVWCASCAIALILTINRILDFYSPRFVRFFFSGPRTYIVLLVPLIYGTYFILFTPPVLFNSKYVNWFFDPMIFPNMSDSYQNIPHIVNNIGVTGVSSALYVCLGSRVGTILKSIKLKQSRSRQKSAQLFLQATIFTLVNLVGGAIYVLMNFITVPVLVIMIAQGLWQFVHAFPIFVYLLLNETIKQGIFKRNKIINNVFQLVTTGNRTNIK